MTSQHCADCSGPIDQDNGPPDGWQLEDGRTVCDVCCISDTESLIGNLLIWRKLGVSQDSPNA